MRATLRAVDHSLLSITEVRLLLKPFLMHLPTQILTNTLLDVYSYSRCHPHGFDHHPHRRLLLLRLHGLCCRSRLHLYDLIFKRCARSCAMVSRMDEKTWPTDLRLFFCVFRPRSCLRNRQVRCWSLLHGCCPPRVGHEGTQLQHKADRGPFLRLMLLLQRCARNCFHQAPY